MKKFDIQGDLNPGTWFPFEDPVKGQTVDQAVEKHGGVKVRVMNQAALNAMTEKTREFTVEYKSRGRGKPRERFEYYKPVENAEQLESEMMNDYSIVDWKGVVDKDDKPIPCTKENKIKLMQNSIEFFRFVTACQKKINDSLALFEEELEGN